ncbi:DUF2790 domain-containing protein [Pseudomonas sp. K2I15]|uniref:DUF2790 domain-containing protein n=1 Tax=unclassified Pseudomonas TaxID=196821 RepID=UPI000B4C7A94|nr:DUF2790 domain-containing protein [Pseudomonas sp. K2I15]OWP69891.1 hypothetical protein CEC48_20635 [Pseudomonas sp. K2I15]
MKTPSRVILFGCALLSANVFALNQQPTAVSTLNRHDIAEVIRIDSNPSACGITDASMIYKTPSGELKKFDYRIWGAGCMGG